MHHYYSLAKVRSLSQLIHISPEKLRLSVLSLSTVVLIVGIGRKSWFPEKFVL